MRDAYITHYVCTRRGDGDVHARPFTLMTRAAVAGERERLADDDDKSAIWPARYKSVRLVFYYRFTRERAQDFDEGEIHLS